MEIGREKCPKAKFVDKLDWAVVRALGQFGTKNFRMGTGFGLQDTFV